MSAPTLAAQPPLPRQVESFYRWLHRWHAQTGVVSPSTPYLAKKQKVSEATIYRWLARLRDAGWIATEQTPGVDRTITPLVPPPARGRRQAVGDRGDARGLRGVDARGSTVLVSDALDAGTQQQPTPDPEPEPAAPAPVVVAEKSTEGTEKPVPAPRPTPRPPVLLPPVGIVAEMLAFGVSRTGAERLLGERGEEACRRQLTSPRLKTARDPAAFLVAAIRDGYAPPPERPKPLLRPDLQPVFVPSDWRPSNAVYGGAL